MSSQDQRKESGVKLKKVPESDESEEEKKEDEMKDNAVADPPELENLSEELVDLFRHKAKYEVNEDGSLTFWPKPGCEPRQRRLHTSCMPMDSAAKKAGCDKIEAMSSHEEMVVNSGANTICSFIEAAIRAWSDHYPFRFKPEHIWLLILQAVAVHVDQNAEKLRKKYVNYSGKMELIVERNEFVLGSDDNDWEGVIEEFAQQIDANSVKDTVQLFDCDFSGSTILEKICAKVTIMVFLEYIQIIQSLFVQQTTTNHPFHCVLRIFARTISLTR